MSESRTEPIRSNTCAAKTRRGRPCRNPARPGEMFCRRHRQREVIKRVRAEVVVRDDTPPSIALLDEIAETQGRINWLRQAIERYKKEAPEHPAAILAAHQAVIAWEASERQHLARLIDAALRHGVDPYMARTTQAMAQRALDAFRQAIAVCGLDDSTAQRLALAMAAALREARDERWKTRTLPSGR